VPAAIRLPVLNDVRMVGRLTRDPELRFTAKGTAVCKFDIAVNRRYKDTASGEWKDDTSFIPVVVWRDAGQRCGDRLKKGSPILVEGRLKSRSWETKEGQKRSGLEVEALRVQFLERMETGGAAAGSDEEPAAQPESDAPAVPADAEEIPF
jgi:single-strand DNA-binding protein